MATKLTVRALEALKKTPPGRDSLIPEGSVAGLYLRARASGGHTWVLHYAPANGTSEERRRGVTYTLGALSKMPLEQARQAAIDQLSAINSGTDPADERRRTRALPTLADLIAQYHASQEWLRKAPRTRASDEGRERQHLIPILGKLPINRIGPAEAWRMHDVIAAGKDSGTRRGKRAVGGPGAARKTLRQLKTLLAWARSREILSVDRLGSVEIGADSHRDRTLENDEWQRVMVAMDALRAEGEIRQRDQDIITLLAYTGARRDEIRRLKWDQLRLDQSLIVLWRAGEHKTGGKTGGKSIALIPEAVDILRRQVPIEGCDLVFPGDGCRPIAINKVWVKVRERAALGSDAVLHLLRHSLATHAAAAGLNAHQIKSMLGHANIATSSRYVHMAQQRLVGAVTIAAAAFTAKKKT